MRFLFLSFFNPDNVGVRCLAALLKKYGHTIHILQVKKLASGSVFPPPSEIGWYVYYQGEVQTDFLIPNISSLECDLVKQGIQFFKPEVICYSGMSTLDDKFSELAQIMAEAAPSSLLIAGGPGPTLAPEHYLQNGADLVIRGEGEESIVELAEVLENKKDWRCVSNICYIDNKKLVCNQMAPLEANLDKYPLPILGDTDFSFVEDEKLVFNKCLRDKGIYLIMGSRGCVGKCSYCSAPRMRKLYDGICSSYIRKRNIYRVLDEAYYAKQQGAYGILFADDFFVRPVKELLFFFKEYKKRVGLHFTMYLHPQQLLNNPQLLDAAIDAGIRSFAFGLQHASERISKYVFKRSRFCTDYPLLVHKILKRGLPVNFHLIEGIPLETKEDFEDNLRFVAQFPNDPSRKPSVQFHIMLLNYIRGASLLEDNPGIENIPRDTTEWVYKCLLLNIRQMTDADDFEKIYSNKYYKNNVTELRNLRNSIDNNLHLDYLKNESRRLKGKEVLFWGAGKVYEARKYLFSDCKPRAILVDQAYLKFTKSDDLPVLPTSILENYEKIPVIMFIKRKLVMKFLREWRYKYPHIDDIVVCTENI